MTELIALLLFFIGILGMGVIVLRKVPVLANLPFQAPKGLFAAVTLRLKEKALKDFSFELFLHKLLSKIRILALKTENKISCWLSQLRQRKIDEKKNCFPEDYWDKLKK